MERQLYSTCCLPYLIFVCEFQVSDWNIGSVHVDVEEQVAAQSPSRMLPCRDAFELQGSSLEVMASQLPELFTGGDRVCLAQAIYSPKKSFLHPNTLI